MTVPFRARPAFLHPLWFVVAFIAMLAAPGLLTQPARPFSTSYLMSLSVMGCVTLLQVAWMHGLHHASRIALRRQTGLELPDRERLFWSIELGLLVMILAWLSPVPLLGPGVEGLAGVVGDILVLAVGLGFVWALWEAATALASFDEGALVRRPTNKVVGFLLALIYVFIGAWVLRPRILKLKADLLAPAP